MIPIFPRRVIACLGLCFLGLASSQAQQFSGRLTFVTGTPVMTSTVVNQTTVYFTPFQGSSLPVYDSTSSDFEPTAFAELSEPFTDATHSPAAAAANSVYDLFVWNNSGTLTLSRGPAWTNGTTRSAGTALVLAEGIWTNSAAITHGPAAGQGTYVGTVKTNSTSKGDFSLGSLAAGGGAATVGVWNCYNRRQYTAAVLNSDASWTASSAWQAADASTTNRVTYVTGLNEDSVTGFYYCYISTATPAGYSVAFDSTTATPSGLIWANQFGGSSPYMAQAGLGVHYVQAINYGQDEAIFIGNDGSGSYAQLRVQGQF